MKTYPGKFHIKTVTQTEKVTALAYKTLLLTATKNTISLQNTTTDTAASINTPNTTCAQWYPLDSLIYSTSSPKKLSVCDTHTMTPVADFEFNKVNAHSWDHSGRLIAVSTPDGVTLVDLLIGSQIQSLRLPYTSGDTHSHSRDVIAAEWCPNT